MIKHNEPPLQDEFQKNYLEEHFLLQLNEALEGIHNKLTSSVKEYDEHPLFIIGSPRSGTTLIYQVFAHSGNYDYPSNFTARFWKAPLVGWLLEKQLKVKESTGRKTYESQFGRTKDIADPHEFSYFWNQYFRLSDSHLLTWEQQDEKVLLILKSIVLKISSVYNKRIIFKNKLLMINPFIISRIFPQADFLYIKRNLLDTALSLYRARLRYYCDATKWFSIKPGSYRKIIKYSPVKQVIEQVKSIYQEIDDQLMRIKNPVHIVHYEALVMKNLSELSPFFSPEILKTLKDTLTIKTESINDKYTKELIRKFESFL